MASLKTRFAPSPTGLMHLGNARTALFSALLGDRFVLRIEDTDSERSRSEFVSALLEDLRWMGLSWEEGPLDPEPVEDFFQSRRGGIYQQYYRRLEAEDAAYPCFCSPVELEIDRKVQLASGHPPRYGGRCARLRPDQVASRLAAGEQPSLRFRVPKGETVAFSDGVRGPQKFSSDEIGDFIIRRGDGTPAFFFCNAIDDALMGINLVLRGEDHLSNTPRQLLILKALGLPLPDYAHISLIVGDDGAPLSKRNGSRSVRQLREEGYFPLAVINMLARVGHHYESDRLLSLAELRAGFQLGHLGKSPSRFDPAHLRHWQEEAVRAMDDELLWPWLRTGTQAVVPQDRRALFLEIVRSNCVFPDEADRWARALFTDGLSLSPELEELVRQAGPAYFLAALDAAHTAGNDFQAFIGLLKSKSGAQGKALFMPLRAALTGRLDGPEIAKLYEALSAERLRHRLAAFAGELG